MLSVVMPNVVAPYENLHRWCVALQNVADATAADNETIKMLADVYLSRGHCYKTFFVRNLRIFVISLSGCTWQAFPA
jgi:hypothetical protein